VTVAQAADATNIKSDHIRAIESGQWKAFSAPVYIKGFVRTYARFLRLDDRAIAADLDAEVGGLDAYAGPPELSPRRKGPLDTVMLWCSRAPWPWIFPAAVAVLGALAIVWAVNASRRPGNKVVAPPVGNTLYQPKKAGSIQTLPLPAVTNQAAPRHP
jgi:cytoskeletal protein RodZ